MFGVAADGRVFTDCSSSTVRIYDSDGNELSSFTHAGTDARAFAVGPDATIVLATDDDIVYVYSADGTLITQWPWEDPGSPSSIAVHQDCVYMLAAANDDVLRFSLDGSFELSWSIENEVLYAQDMVVDQKGRVFILDSQKDAIQYYTADGEQLGTIRDIGTPFDFVSPLSIGLDGDGWMYVLDLTQDSVFTFDTDLKPRESWAVADARDIEGASGGVFYVVDSFNPPGLRKYVLARSRPCTRYDLDGDCDVDINDFRQLAWAFTGVATRPAFVARAPLFDGSSSDGSYFSGDNTLRGFAWTAGTAPAELVLEWSVESQPDGSGTVTIFDPHEAESQFVVSAPAVAGEYVFEFTATVAGTESSASESVTLTLIE